MSTQEPFWLDHVLEGRPPEERSRFATVGLLTALLVHELASPATVILGRVELLRRAPSFPADPALRTAVEEVHREANRIAWLLRQIRTFLLQGRRLAELSGTPRADLNGVVQDAVSTIKRWDDTRAITFEETYGHLLPVPLNPGWLGQVFLNILKNAREAMEGAGTISIRTAQPTHERVEVSISDTGPGIDPERLRDLFTPLATPKEGQGMGVGLPLCHAVVTAHRGRIEVESARGRGTTFRILLPTNPSEGMA